MTEEARLELATSDGPNDVFSEGAAGSLLSRLRAADEVQPLLGELLAGERGSWLKVCHSWIAFLIALGGLNLYVAYNYPESTWVTFKLVSIGIQFAYMLATLFWLASKAQPTESQ